MQSVLPKTGMTSFYDLMLLSRLACLAPCAFFLSLLHSPAGEVLKPEDRIVFIGDSITGQGGRGEGGWMALIGKALKQSDPANKQTLIPLGGSGHKVASWGNIEKKSRTAPVLLDIKEFDVQKELGQHADVVVIMLGMNDVLSAQLPNSPEGIRGWKEDYRSLLKAVRERTSPRVLALATPTPCTEDPASPKNQVMEAMVVAMQELAKEEGCRILPTRDTAWEVLKAGRAVRPDFHITTDQVHPNTPGHAAIAAGMLRGLDEAGAADLLRNEAVGRAKGAGLSVEWALHPAQQSGLPVNLKLSVYHKGDAVELTLPKGWSASEPEKGEGVTTYAIAARPEYLKNVVTLRSGDKTLESVVPAPWLVATANAGWIGWKSGVFDVDAGKWPVDEIIRTGAGFSEARKEMELKPGIPLAWRTYLGSINYGGGGAPGVIDFAQVTYFTGGEIGYGLRWVESDKDRSVRVKVSRPGFAGMTHAQVWINGESVFAGDPSKTKDVELKAFLRKGWNLVSFKGNFQQWQWQLGIDLEPEPGDSLEALRYSIEPR
jgi:lysophospholipase L1-like esterase